MAVFIILWPYLSTTKLSIGHTNLTIRLFENHSPGPMNMISTKAKANKSLLKAVHLISGTDRTQIEVRLPTKPKAATTKLRMASDQSWQVALSSKVS